MLKNLKTVVLEKEIQDFCESIKYILFKNYDFVVKEIQESNFTFRTCIVFIEAQDLKFFIVKLN